MHEPDIEPIIEPESIAAESILIPEHVIDSSTISEPIKVPKPITPPSAVPGTSSSTNPLG